jgi:hypothetical protein
MGPSSGPQLDFILLAKAGQFNERHCLERELGLSFQSTTNSLCGHGPATPPSLGLDFSICLIGCVRRLSVTDKIPETNNLKEGKAYLCSIYWLALLLWACGKADPHGVNTLGSNAVYFVGVRKQREEVEEELGSQYPL